MIKGFKMKLFPGQEAEYERRHNLLWPEMKEAIHRHGGRNYTIFLDRETLTLFGTIEIDSEEEWAKQADEPINRKWWDFMADIMETNPTALSVWTCTGCFIWIERVKEDSRDSAAVLLLCVFGTDNRNAVHRPAGIMSGWTGPLSRTS